ERTPRAARARPVRAVVGAAPAPAAGGRPDTAGATARPRADRAAEAAVRRGGARARHGGSDVPAMWRDAARDARPDGGQRRDHRRRATLRPRPASPQEVPPRL